MNLSVDLKIVFDFLSRPLHVTYTRPAGVMLVFGNYRPTVAERAADLLLAGRAPVAILSGARDRNGKLPKEYATEARMMREVILARGVEKDRLYLEERATNTLENVLFSKELMKEKGIRPSFLIGVCRAPLAQRSLATLERHLPGIRFEIDAPPENPAEGETNLAYRERLIGEIERLKRYADQGDINRTSVPRYVEEAVARIQLVSA